MAAKKVRTGAESKALILDAGAKLASRHGAKNVTRRMVATAAKVAESLVTHYMGGAGDAQKKYATRAKKLGLKLPTEEQANAIGKKLRAHKPGDKRDTRARSAKERVAVAKKSAAGAASAKSAKASPVSKSPAAPRSKPKPASNKALSEAADASDELLRATVAATNAAALAGLGGKPKPASNKALPGPAENKTAARAPMAAPAVSVPPLPVSVPPLPVE